jgi:hypothetical protein
MLARSPDPQPTDDHPGPGWFGGSGGSVNLPSISDAAPDPPASMWESKRPAGSAGRWSPRLRPSVCLGASSARGRARLASASASARLDGRRFGRSRLTLGRGHFAAAGLGLLGRGFGRWPVSASPRASVHRGGPRPRHRRSRPRASGRFRHGRWRPARPSPAPDGTVALHRAPRQLLLPRARRRRRTARPRRQPAGRLRLGKQALLPRAGRRLRRVPRRPPRGLLGRRELVANLGERGGERVVDPALRLLDRIEADQPRSGAAAGARPRGAGRRRPAPARAGPAAPRPASG